MRMRLAIIIITALLALPSFGQSKGDWNAVRRIDRGRLITLKAPAKLRCRFVDATDDKLFCDTAGPFYTRNSLAIDRNDVLEVRLELADGYNWAVNASIGTVTGVTAGAIANAANPRSGTDARFDLGLIGFLLGGASAHQCHIVHGRIIYRR